MLAFKSLTALLLVVSAVFSGSFAANDKIHALARGSSDDSASSSSSSSSLSRASSASTSDTGSTGSLDECLRSVLAAKKESLERLEQLEQIFRQNPKCLSLEEFDELDELRAKYNVGRSENSETRRKDWALVYTKEELDAARRSESRKKALRRKLKKAMKRKKGKHSGHGSSPSKKHKKPAEGKSDSTPSFSSTNTTSSWTESTTTTTTGSPACVVFDLHGVLFKESFTAALKYIHKKTDLIIFFLQNIRNSYRIVPFFKELYTRHMDHFYHTRRAIERCKLPRPNMVRSPSEPRQVKDPSGKPYPILVKDIQLDIWDENCIIREFHTYMDDLYKDGKISEAEKHLISTMNKLQFTPRYAAEVIKPTAGYKLVEDITNYSNNTSVYLISNIASNTFEAIRENHGDFFKRFKGIVVSGQVGYLKPDLKIFEHFQDTFHEKGKCYFLDDTLENVDGAIEAGLTGLLVKNNYFGWKSIRDQLREDNIIA